VKLVHVSPRRLPDKRAPDQARKRKQFLAAIAALVVEEVESRRRVAVWLRRQSRDARVMRRRLDAALDATGREIRAAFLATFESHPKGGRQRTLSTGEVLRIYQVGLRWEFSIRDSAVLYVSNRRWKTQEDVARYLLHQIGLMCRDEDVDLLAKRQSPGRMGKHH
jgi:hypothetical protein